MPGSPRRSRTGSSNPAIMALDEYGVPVQVGQRIQGVLDPQGDLDTALKRLHTLDLQLPYQSPRLSANC